MVGSFCINRPKGLFQYTSFTIISTYLVYTFKYFGLYKEAIMPWSETTIMDERYCAIRELLTSGSIDTMPRVFMDFSTDPANRSHAHIKRRQRLKTWFWILIKEKVGKHIKFIRISESASKILSAHRRQRFTTFSTVQAVQINTTEGKSISTLECLYSIRYTQTNFGQWIIKVSSKHGTAFIATRWPCVATSAAWYYAPMVIMDRGRKMPCVHWQGFSGNMVCQR